MPEEQKLYYPLTHSTTHTRQSDLFHFLIFHLSFLIKNQLNSLLPRSLTPDYFVHLSFLISITTNKYIFVVLALLLLIAICYIFSRRFFLQFASHHVTSYDEVHRILPKFSRLQKGCTQS